MGRIGCIKIKVCEFVIGNEWVDKVKLIRTQIEYVDCVNPNMTTVSFFIMLMTLLD